MQSNYILVYTSKSRKPIDQPLLQEILKVAHAFNARDEITGFLVVRDGYFLQLLEGPREKVEACYARICADSRHKLVTLQGEATTEKRIMPTWNMALVDPETAMTNAAELIEMFELGRQGEQYKDPKSLEGILRLFSREAKIIQ